MTAQALWLDPDRLEIRARSPDETRTLVVGRVNVDFPVELLQEIDRRARRLGVTRQAFIKVRMADSLERP